MENWQLCLKAFLNSRFIHPYHKAVAACDIYYGGGGIMEITTPWQPPPKTRNRGDITMEKIEDVFSLLHKEHHNFFQFEVVEGNGEEWVLSVSYRCWKFIQDVVKPKVVYPLCFYG